MHVAPKLLRHAAALALALVAWPALAAAPKVTLVPPAGARFLPGQRFDVRAEVDAATATATLTLDGRPLAFTSGAPAGADGISPPGIAGFNVRGLSVGQPGRHVLRVEATAAGEKGAAETTFEVVALPGGKGRVRNVILFLGDGMGIAHRTAARIVRHGVVNGDPAGRLAMDELPGTGLVSTHSLSSIVTDSSPGMSCYTTGNHQHNNQEGVWPARVTNPFLAPRVEYLGHYLHRTRGTALGLVTTGDLEDATPAANAVHTASRAAGTGIVDQYLDEADPRGTRTHGSGLRALLGGGRRWFVPASNPRSSRANATDYAGLPADLLAGWKLPAQAAGALDPERDLVAGFRAAGYGVVDSKAQLDATLRTPPERLLGLFAWGNMSTAYDKIAGRRGDPVVNDHLAPDQPMLDEMTDAALKVLARSEAGFVLVVEGAHIDKQSHAMDADRAIGEVLELDRAVARGLAFARRDQKTLVLVTADHECSGFSVLGARGGGFPRYAIAPDGYPVRWDVDGKLLVGFGATADGSGVHTATDVPISAYAADPEAWRPFVGVHTNTDVFFEIAGVFLGGAP